jgi:ribonuclease E
MRKDSSQETVTAKVSEELARYLLNHKRARLSAMEEEFKKKIVINAL